MKTTKEVLLVAAAMSFLGVPVMQAQETAPKHEVSVAIQGLGIGSMPFRGPVSWDDQAGLSLGFGVGYTYWFNETFGFRTGLRMARLSHNQYIANLNTPFVTKLDVTGPGVTGGKINTDVHFRGTASTIQEEQQYTFIELPLQLAMRFNALYVNVGLSLSKAVAATADYSYTDPGCVITEIEALSITSEVPLTLNNEMSGTVKNNNMPKPFYMLLDAEAGYNIPLGDATSLALGLYGRLAPIARRTNNEVDIYAVNYDNATYAINQPTTNKLVERVGYYEVGLSLGVNFGVGQKRSHAADETVLTPVDTRYDEMSSELAAMKAAQQKSESELAAMKAAKQKTEDELAALKAAQKQSADELAALKEKQAAAARQPIAAPAQTTGSAAATAQPLAAGDIQVNFDFNKSTPIYDQATENAIRALCERMKNDESIRAVVTGYTDNVGTQRGNRKIGRKRADAVRRQMVKFGAPKKNISIVSRGENDPVATNDTDEGRAINRRAVISVK